MDAYDTTSRHLVHTASGRSVRLPVTAAQFRSLMAYVDEVITLSGCDDTLGFAEAWARAHGVAWGRLARSLRGLGAFCDCEIAMNIADSELGEVETSGLSAGEAGFGEREPGG